MKFLRVVLFAAAFAAVGSGRAAESGKLSGSVVDQKGTPIAGAGIVVSAPVVSGFSYSGWRDMEVGRATTGADGKFTVGNLPVDAPKYRVVVTAAGYPSAEKIVVNERPGKDYALGFTLDQTKVIAARGMVVDSQGRPLEGVRVSGQTSSETHTDQSGRFELGGIVPDDHEMVYLNFWKKSYVHADKAGPKPEATSGDWKVTLHTEDETAVTGHAYFADGTPASGRVIRLKLKRPNGDEFFTGAAKWDESKTDAAGAFSIKMRQPGSFQAMAILEDDVWYRFGEPHGSWTADAGEVTQGKSGLKLVFENRGRIDVALAASASLPPDRQYRIECRMEGVSEGKSSAMIAAKTATPSRPVVRFDALSPGSYTIGVKDVKAEHNTWEKKIELRAAGGDTGTSVTFELPEMEFGGLRAQFFEPDGKTPVANGSVWLDAHGSHGWHPIRNGVVDLDGVPIGAATLTPRIENLYPAKASGIVRAGAVTDLGKIVLVPMDQATGWVEGRVLFDDGTPALGALVLMGFENKTVAADGSYRKQVPAGENNIIVSLDAVARWPRTDRQNNPPGMYAAGSCRDWISAKVNVEAGKTARRDIVVPLENLGSARMNWLGDPNKKLFRSLAVIMGDQIFIAETFDDGSSKWLNNLPPGKRVMLVRSDDYRGYQEIKATSGETVFTFDPAIAGSISGRVDVTGGIAADRYSISLAAAGLFNCGMHKEINGNNFVVSQNGGIAGVKPGIDGKFRISGVAPGAYILRVHGPAAPIVRGVDVKAHQETVVDMSAGLDKE